MNQYHQYWSTPACWCPLGTYWLKQQSALVLFWNPYCRCLNQQIHRHLLLQVHSRWPHLLLLHSLQIHFFFARVGRVEGLHIDLELLLCFLGLRLRVREPIATSCTGCSPNTMFVNSGNFNLRHSLKQRGRKSYETANSFLFCSDSAVVISFKIHSNLSRSFIHKVW